MLYYVRRGGGVVCCGHMTCPAVCYVVIWCGRVSCGVVWCHVVWCGAVGYRAIRLPVWFVECVGVLVAWQVGLFGSLGYLLVGRLMGERCVVFAPCGVWCRMPLFAL